MPINSVIASTAMTVYEGQDFISRHFISPASVLSSYTITTAASPVGSGFATAVTVSINGTSMTISGRYTRIFIDNEWDLRLAKMNSNIGTYYSIESIPDEYWGPTRFEADTRISINVSINIVTNNGSTSITQIVRNDWSRQRNQLLDVVYNGLADRNSINRIDDIPLPQPIDSDNINTSFPFTAVITSNTLNYNIKDAAIAAGWSGLSPLLANITVNAGVYVYSNTTSIAAMLTGTDIPVGSTINIVNNGFIMGRGGAGGGTAIGTNAVVSTMAGGPAMEINAPVNITNNSYIAGGGGGGGRSDRDNSGYPHNGGGGGGAGGGPGGPGGTNPGGNAAGGAGGAPGSPGSSGGFASFTDGFDIVYNRAGGGGGGRMLPGTTRHSATEGGGGQAGGMAGAIWPSTQGYGGLGNAVGGPDTSNSSGGGGGGWGAAGGRGSIALGAQASAVGAAGGKAINLNGNTVTFDVTGTVWGAVS